MYSIELVYVEKKQSDQTVLDLTHLDEEVNIASVWTKSKPKKKFPYSANTQKGAGANHSSAAVTMKISHGQISAQLKIFSPALLSWQLNASDCNTDPLHPYLTAELLNMDVQGSLFYTYCQPAQLSRCYQDILLHKFWQLQKAPGDLNVSEAQEVWNSRRAPRQKAKGDHSTEAWPQV